MEPSSGFIVTLCADSQKHKPWHNKLIVLVLGRNQHVYFDNGEKLAHVMFLMIMIFIIIYYVLILFNILG